MNPNLKRHAAEIARKYAEKFNVSLGHVTVEEIPGCKAIIRCPRRPDLPRWETEAVH